MEQLRYICIHILIQCRSTSHCKDVQSHFLDVNVYKWMLSSTPIEVEVERFQWFGALNQEESVRLILSPIPAIVTLNNVEPV